MKKLLKIVLYSMLVFICTLLIAIVIFVIRNKIFLGSSKKEFVEYLEVNSQIFDNEVFNNCNSPLSVFSEEVYNSTIVLLGETHGYAEVQEVDKMLFIHFNKTKGTRYYIAEMDSVTANNLNLFLQSEPKNLSILTGVVEDVRSRILQQAGKELFDKWSDIYDYNRTLADSLKIQVIGIDKSRNATTKISRDSAMVVNLMQEVDRLKLHDESFYGLFGLFHVLQEGINSNNIRSLGARLKSRGVSIQSIVCLNLDSEVNFPKVEGFPSPKDGKTSLVNMDGPIVLVEGIKDLEKASEPQTITLFNLDRADSPYRSSQRLGKTKTNFIDQSMFPFRNASSTVDLFQYALLLRNAKPITPLD
ncbi:hypothetical protein [Dysgonomonas massiliensis]|uniref:hypothetical protein n=1 Tax=Dysgonomonas massiliensis TaxID=2040292 RepID=UPI0011AF2C3B|nr:hypothetical protein [Dysgonomonas massiliensis]